MPAILFRDPRYVVLDKPAGLKVHAGPGGGPSVEDGFAQLSRRADGPWLAHRLDADTAGCLLVALRKRALIEAQALFAAGQVEKVYWAVVRGRPAQDGGVIDAPLAKVARPGGGWRMQVARTGGDAARTEWRWRGGHAGLSWLELRPRTGRTHQIRVHCAALGVPLLGDEVYGAAGSGVGLHLLARALRLDLPEPVAAVAPVPAAMRAAFAACGWQQP